MIKKAIVNPPQLAVKLPFKAKCNVYWDYTKPQKEILHTSACSISSPTTLGRLQGCSWERLLFSGALTEKTREHNDLLNSPLENTVSNR